jgi:hypothetical protein
MSAESIDSNIDSTTTAAIFSDVSSKNPPVVPSLSTKDDDIIDSFHVIVLVLRDLGTSPRMQYHANSLLQAGHSVSLVGYVGEVCTLSITSRNKNGKIIRICTLKYFYQSL